MHRLHEQVLQFEGCLPLSFPPDVFPAGHVRCLCYNQQYWRGPRHTLDPAMSTSLAQPSSRQFLFLWSHGSCNLSPIELNHVRLRSTETSVERVRIQGWMRRTFPRSTIFHFSS